MAANEKKARRRAPILNSFAAEVTKVGKGEDQVE